jgi:hypothetical protein
LLLLVSKPITTWATQSLFSFSLFFKQGLMLFPGTSFGLQSSYLCLLNCWDYGRHVPPHLTCSLRLGLANFCLGWPQILILPFLPPT